MLYNYRSPAGAARMLRRLRYRWPNFDFEAVPSPLSGYSFRWLIRARGKVSGETAFVSREGEPRARRNGR